MRGERWWVTLIEVGDFVFVFVLLCLIWFAFSVQI